MRTLNPGSQNCCDRKGVFDLGLLPDTRRPTAINVNLIHGHNHHQLTLPFDSTFGYVKSVLAETLGLKPHALKLFFRGKEQEDAADFQTAGVTENSDILLTEDAIFEHQIPEHVQQISVVSKGEEAVAEVRLEVDKLERQVSTLKAAVDYGTKVDDKEIICFTEMLMRQLLKLDGIEAEGEGKVARKVEVRRVQSLVETLDVLKSSNSKQQT